MKIDSLTPRQFAHDITLWWLQKAYWGVTGDLDHLTPAQKEAARKAIAKLHSELAVRANLDAVPLG